MSSIPNYGQPSYGFTRTLAGVSFDEASSRVRTALSEQGFGVLTEIDIQGTLAKKLGVETRKYTILGACNPKLAHRALGVEPGIGLLLPCNVIVSENDEGGTVISAIDPVAMFGVVGRDDIEPIAQEVKALLEAAITAA